MGSLSRSALRAEPLLRNNSVRHDSLPSGTTTSGHVILFLTPTFDSLTNLFETLLDLGLDAIRLARANLRPRCALAAENLFLRKQLALHIERNRKPRRAKAASKLTLVLLSRLFAWREALTVVKPDTLIRWHRKGFRLLWR